MKSRLRIISSFIFILFLISCSEPVKRSREIEEVAIYSLLLVETCKQDYKDTSVLIIGETHLTNISTDIIPFWREPFLDKEIFTDFQSANQENHILNPDLVDNTNFCKMVSYKELESVWEDINWHNSHMFIRFSVIGFNNNLDQAIVYKEYNCGVECAGGDFYYIILKNNIWKIQRIARGFRS